MQILTIQASTEKDALKAGAEKLDVSVDEIEAHIHKKGGGGFLGIGSKTPSVFTIHTIAEKTPANAVIRGVVMMLTSRLGFDVKVVSVELKEDDKLYVTMESDKAGHIIGKRGKTLESLQFLVNLLVQQFTGEPPKILLDIENYRERRAKYLTDIAQKMANMVAKYGKSRLLEPLNPFERRLIHVALQEDERVETESEGVGVYKRVRIKSKNRPEPVEKKKDKPTKKSPKPESETTKESDDDFEGRHYSEEEEEKLAESVLVEIEPAEDENDSEENEAESGEIPEDNT